MKPELPAGDDRKIPEAQRQGELRFRRLVEAMPVAVYVCDKSGLIQSYNKSAQELWGREPKLGDTSERYCGSLRLYSPDGKLLSHEKSKMEEVLRTGVPAHDWEVVVERPDGSRITALANISPLRNDEGELIGAVNCVRDITERKRAEDKVRESQQLLHLVLATLPVGVAVTDRAGDIVLANAASNRIWGNMIVAGRERWAQSKGFWHDSGKRIAPPEWASVRALSEGQTSLNELIDIETFDGQRKTIQNSSAPIRNAEGLIVGTVIVNEDVTEQVRAEGALRQSEDRIRLFIDTIPTMAWSVQRDGTVDYLNQRWLDYSGLSFREYIAEPTRPIHPEDIPRVLEKWRASMASGEPYEVEMRLRRADGEYRWFLVRTAPLRDEEGNIVKWFGCSFDIEDRKRAEQMLLVSHGQLRALSARLQSVREEEATRISREIHDDLGQKLTGLKLDLQWLECRLEQIAEQGLRTELEDKIISASNLADETMVTVQRIAADLRPAILDSLGLISALRYAASQFESRTGIGVKLKLPSAELNLDPAVATAVYRIFQEILTNLARHAQATEAKVSADARNNILRLVVEDNGKGCLSGELRSPKSLGLLGMKERAALLNGNLKIESTPGRGTTALLEVPLELKTV